MPEIGKQFDTIQGRVREFTNSLKMTSEQFNIDDLEAVEPLSFPDLSLAEYTLVNVTAIVQNTSGSGTLSLESSVDGQNFLALADSLFSDGANSQTVDGTETVYTYSISQFTEEFIQLVFDKGDLTGGTIQVIVLAKNDQ